MGELYLLLSLPEWLWSATTGTQLLPPSVMLHARKCQGTECMQLHLLEQVGGGSVFTIGSTVKFPYHMAFLVF